MMPDAVPSWPPELCRDWRVRTEVSLSPPNYPDWAPRLFRAAAATLHQRGWHPGRVAERAPWVAKDAVAAWKCYERGAAGALLDILATFDAVGLAPSPDIAAERDSLIGAALRGKGKSRGQGARSPLAAHDAALRKRLRWTVVCWLRSTAARYQEEDAYAQRERLGAEYWSDRATWPDMPCPVMMACCERARKDLGETTVGWRTIYEDVRRVAKARRTLGPAWPGPFYLPSEDTCKRLDLGAGLRLLRGQWAPADAPSLRWV